MQKSHLQRRHRRYRYRVHKGLKENRVGKVLQAVKVVLAILVGTVVMGVLVILVVLALLVFVGALVLLVLLAVA
jgi:uncharacterized membrane protein SpoIIM required for sporulation